MTMETKHTPGPWELRHGCYIFAGGREISTVWKGVSIDEKDQDESNAHLIAAAPKLLEALKLALHVRGTSEDTIEIEEAMRTAIAKAESMLK